MSEPFIAEIIMFGGNFAPRNWAFCDGQLLSISQNQALFSLIGTYYGGDGQVTFALPDLRGRVPIHFGQGPGLPGYSLGERAGAATTTLTSANLPAHTHSVAPPANTGEGQNTQPDGAVPAAGEMPTQPYAGSSNTTMASYPTSSAGANQPFNNMPPYLAVSFIICLAGVYPSRS
jgi:microcystin-dependent protein